MGIFENLRGRIGRWLSGTQSEYEHRKETVRERIDELNESLETEKQSIEDIQDQLTSHPLYEDRDHDYGLDPVDDDWFDL